MTLGGVSCQPVKLLLTEGVTAGLLWKTPGHPGRGCSDIKFVSEHPEGPVAREGELGHQSLGMLRQSELREDRKGARMGQTGASGETPHVLMVEMLEMWLGLR